MCSASQRIIKLFNIFSSGITINSLLPLFYWAVMQLFKELKINLNISILFKIINIVVVKDIMTYKVWMRAFVWNPDLVWCWTFFPWKKPASHFMRERERVARQLLPSDLPTVDTRDMELCRVYHVRDLIWQNIPHLKHDIIMSIFVLFWGHKCHHSNLILLL